MMDYCKSCDGSVARCLMCEAVDEFSAPTMYRPLTRGAFLLGMTQEELADYLTRELADGVPGDWAAWLNEEVTVG